MVCRELRGGCRGRGDEECGDRLLGGGEKEGGNRVDMNE
jgi:hypothetical protein